MFANPITLAAVMKTSGMVIFARNTDKTIVIVINVNELQSFTKKNHEISDEKLLQ